MSTISLENFKPRRGRRPKKSDIYHLIHKNYGINLMSETTNEKVESQKIKSKHQISQCAEEPLNLCVREHNDRPSLVKQEIIPSKKMENVQKTKKKRSSIFSPNGFSKNEISICKFKLANGSLQEKKFVSVGANGSFNFGSARIDQQKKTIPEENIPKKNTATNSKFIRDFQSSKSIIVNSNEFSSLENQRKKRSEFSRQDGFLIQTQKEQKGQCSYFKFRHITSFTRYLFRNWKNYLPAESTADKNLFSKFN